MPAPSESNAPVGPCNAYHPISRAAQPGGRWAALAATYRRLRHIRNPPRLRRMPTITRGNRNRPTLTTLVDSDVAVGVIRGVGVGGSGVSATTVAVATCVGVGLGTSVGVTVGVAVFVGIGVGVGDGVGVSVGVGVGIGVGVGKAMPQVAASSASRNAGDQFETGVPYGPPARSLAVRVTLPIRDQDPCQRWRCGCSSRILELSS